MNLIQIESDVYIPACAVKCIGTDYTDGAYAVRLDYGVGVTYLPTQSEGEAVDLLRRIVAFLREAEANPGAVLDLQGEGVIA